MLFAAGRFCRCKQIMSSPSPCTDKVMLAAVATLTIAGVSAGYYLLSDKKTSPSEFPWLERLLAKFSIPPPDAREDPSFSIMNDHNKTLLHPFLSVDVNLLVQRVIDVGRIAPSTRSKPVLMAVTGMGRGKTRMIVEIHRELVHSYPSVLSIPITFNHYWDQVCKISEDPNVVYTFAIIARLISMHFHVKLDRVYEAICEALTGVGRVTLETRYEAILRECVRLIVLKCRQERAIDLLVISVDESLKVCT